MNGHPLSPRKTVQLLVIMTILAWATQTLLHQWAAWSFPSPRSRCSRPSLPPARMRWRSSATGQAPAAGAGVVGGGRRNRQERAGEIDPRHARFFAGATLEIRSEATILGGEVKLRQVCRWSEADKAAFEPVADMVLARMGPNTPFRAVTNEEIKQLLHDAGLNLGVIRFAGALSCTVSRGDVPYDEQPHAAVG